MTPNLNLNSNAKFLQIFGIPFLQTQNMKTSRGPTPKCYTFLETSHNPQLESQLRCQNFATFLATHLLKIRILKLPEVLPPNVIPFWNIDLTLYLITSSHYPFPLPLALNLLQLTPIPLPIYLGCDFIDTSLVSC